MSYSEGPIRGIGTSAYSCLLAVSGDWHSTVCLLYSIHNASFQEGHRVSARELLTCQSLLCQCEVICYMQSHEGPPQLRGHTLTATTQLPCDLLLRDTVIDHGTGPINHQGCWTPDRHGHIGLHQGLRIGATWETAEQTVTVRNTRTNPELDWSLPWRPDPEHRSRWLLLHHCQCQLWHSAEHKHGPFALSTVH